MEAMKTMKTKMSRKEAEITMYELWQMRRLPEDFTNEHAQYEPAINLLLEKGKLAASEITFLYSAKEKEEEY